MYYKHLELLLHVALANIFVLIVTALTQSATVSFQSLFVRILRTFWALSKLNKTNFPFRQSKKEGKERKFKIKWITMLLLLSIKMKEKKRRRASMTQLALFLLVFY